jgi:hypothetical protein
MWFVHWHRWLRGSALHKAVRAGPHGSTFVSPRHRRHHRHTFATEQPGARSR